MTNIETTRARTHAHARTPIRARVVYTHARIPVRARVVCVGVCAWVHACDACVHTCVRAGGRQVEYVLKVSALVEAQMNQLETCPYSSSQFRRVLEEVQVWTKLRAYGGMDRLTD